MSVLSSESLAIPAFMTCTPLADVLLSSSGCVIPAVIFSLVLDFLFYFQDSAYPGLG